MTHQSINKQATQFECSYRGINLTMAAIICASHDVLAGYIPTNWLQLSDDQKIDFLESCCTEADEHRSAIELWTDITRLASYQQSDDDECFIFGNVPCDIYNEKGFDVLLAKLEADELPFVFRACQFSTKTPPSKVIESSCGFMGEAQISKEEFKQITAVLDKRGNDSLYRLVRGA